MSDRTNSSRRAAIVSPPDRLTSRMTVDEAIAGVLTQNQAELVAAMRAALDRPMPETVHELRTALQSLHAALALSARWADSEALTEILRDARALSDALGETRHWDILIAETLARHIDTLADIADVAVLTEGAAVARQEGYRRVRLLLDGPLPQKLLLGLAFIVSQQRWRDEGGRTSKRLAGDVRVRAKREVARLDKRLLDRGKRLRRLPDETRHALAVEVKHLRDTIELLQSIWPRPARIRRYRDRVQALQSALDGLDDARTTQLLLNRIASDDPSPLVQRAVGAIGGWVARDKIDRLSALDELWREFRSAKRFW
ncbi:MAG: CHAD domain-containing protein [Candidatus Kaistia colombiensis]|nr:MAG: CHAD domain-containing protein [Kaistia sp.]